MNVHVHLSNHLKGFVSSTVIGKMMMITIIMAIILCATTFFFGPNFGAKAYAQEINNDNSTLLLEDMHSIIRDQQRDIASISNSSSTEVELMENMISRQLEYWSGDIWTKIDVKGGSKDWQIYDYNGMGIDCPCNYFSWPLPVRRNNRRSDIYGD
jgi:hypothetical protein